MKVSSREQPVLLRLFIIAGSRLIRMLACSVSTICFAQAPANDHFTNAIPLYGSSVTFTGTLASATYEPGESPNLLYAGFLFHSFPAGGSVWWSWTATNSSAVVMASLSSVGGTNSAFAVHHVSNISEVVEDSVLEFNFLDRFKYRQFAFLASAGEMYYIRAMGETTDPFTLQLTATDLPVILLPPQAQAVPAGGSTIFDVQAAARYPISYQWQVEGTNLSGETKPILLRHGLTAEDAGDYSVVCSDSFGAVTGAVAHLTIAPVDPRPELAALMMPDTNRFFFTLNGLTGRRYRIESSTNLLDWTSEPSITPGEGSDLPTLPGIIVNTNSTSLFSVVRDAARKFFRGSPYVTPEACIAHLREIDAGLQHSAIEWRKGLDDYVTFTDILPWVRNLPSCPALSGQPFAAGYYITNRSVRPNCLVSPAVHRLPP